HVKYIKSKFEANNFNDTLFYHNSSENLKDRLIKNDSRTLSYNIRNSADLIEPMAKTNSGEITFGFFYSRFRNRLGIYFLNVYFKI
ncbi:hypothetical protein BpHYR1_053191, partial [Brachionus plicatilis]